MVGSVVRRRWVVAAAVAGAAGGLGLASWRYRASEIDADALESFHSGLWIDAEGRSFDAASLRGRALVLNFWATWCPPCVDEMPELDALHGEFSPKGAQIVGIGIDSRDKIRDFAGKHPLSYPLLAAGAGGPSLARALGNASGALPYTVVVDVRGRIRERILGRFALPRLRSALQSALRA